MMNRLSRSILSLILTLALVMSMGLSVTFADDTEGDASVAKKAPKESAIEDDTIETDALLKTAPSQNDEYTYSSDISPTNLNSKAKPKIYSTAELSGWNDYYFKVKVPAAGSLKVVYASPDGSDVYVDASVNGTRLTLADSFTTSSGAKVKWYIVPKASTVDIEYSVYNSDDYGYGNIYFQYARKAYGTLVPQVGKNKYFYYGGTGSSSKATAFKIKVTRKGLLNLNMGDASGDSYHYSLYIKTNGFTSGNGEYLTYKDAERNIGVKPGVYTIIVRSSAPVYGVRYRLIPVSETKYGAKKKKAVKIKKNKVSKGLIVSNAKKAHWYKFKNPKKQKVRLVLSTRLNGGGNGTIGGIKVTISGKGSSTYRVIYSNTKSGTITIYNTSGTKLKKGTYYIKVESYKSGNGYYALKWK